jgi:hypothetical protein
VSVPRRVGGVVKLRLDVVHTHGHETFESWERDDLRRAGLLLVAIANGGPDTGVRVPGEAGSTLLRVGDIDRADLTWEA